MWHGPSPLHYPYVWGVEFGGLIIAVVTAVIMVFAVPAAISRRKAVVASREGDRFSSGVDLVCARVRVIDSNSRRQSTRPLLPTAGGALSEGTIMSDEAAERGSVASPTKAQSRRQISGNPIQQMAALRARRAARLSREAAAVKQRVAGAVAGSVLMIAFAIAAASGAIPWGWIAVPAVVLVATVASSMWGSMQAQKNNATEISELKRIKRAMGAFHGTGTPQSQKDSARPPRVQPVEAAAQETFSSRAVRQPVKQVKDAEVIEAVTAQTAVEIDADRVETQSETYVQERRSVLDRGEDARVATASDQSGAVVEHASATESAPAISRDTSRREWSVTTLPPVRGKSAAPAPRRQVHADTDLVPTVTRRSAGVPARPLRKSATVAAATETAAQATGPTFRFDLDAVLDQRRAQ